MPRGMFLRGAYQGWQTDRRDPAGGENQGQVNIGWGETQVGDPGRGPHQEWIAFLRRCLCGVISGARIVGIGGTESCFPLLSAPLHSASFFPRARCLGK